jgi:uridine kinase
MSASSHATVISVAAPPGGGKTTLSRMISARLGNAPILHFDKYETFTARSTAEVEAWVDRGAPFAEITAPSFGEDLARLRAGGASYVVVDAPVGRAHPATAAMIDFLIFVDAPLDVALARVIRAQAVRAAGAADPAVAQGFATWLETYLDNYPRFMRRIYDVQRANVMPQADLVLDGTLVPERLTELAVAAIAAKVS